MNITKNEFLQKIADFEKNPKKWIFLGKKPAIVDFYASWCGPCKMVSPILDELAKEYEGKLDIYKVDTEEEFELAEAFGIRTIPSLLFIPQHEEPQMLHGALNKTDFKKLISQILSVN